MKIRALTCFILCITLFFGTILRLSTISTTDYYAASGTQNGIRLLIGKNRGTIYDCNKIPLTNNEEKIIAAVSPTPRAITAISQLLKEDELEKVLEQLKSGKPALCEIPKKIVCDGIVCTNIFSDSNIVSRHIIGYTDKESNGLSGIEKAYDNILHSEEDITVFYNTDAKGRILDGIEPELNNPNYAIMNGVVTTLDINIQTIAEKFSENLEMGAIVVADAKTAKIRACVSCPSFDRKNMQLYLDDENSPLLNRAINSYNVGSVFKPCVAAAGIENKKNDFIYNCTGSCKIVDRFFKCHKLSGHGTLDLEGGLAYSCNTFFYNFTFNIGYENVLNTAKKLSFGQKIKMCDELYTTSGKLPEEETLKNIAHLANFSIGQGDLLLSPVSMLTLYCAVASNGRYYIPSVVEGIIENTRYSEYNNGASTIAFSAETADILKKYLKSVIDEGTGGKAKPKTVTAAGKTATAQTGKFRNGREISESWFCGFFPADNPEYVVIVFSEDEEKQSITCSEIFANIADEINTIKK